MRQRIGSHHPRTHFLLFGGKVSAARNVAAARDHPYSWGAPYTALGGAGEGPTVWKKGKGDQTTSLSVGQQDQVVNTLVFGRVGRGGGGYEGRQSKYSH